MMRLIGFLLVISMFVGIPCTGFSAGITKDASYTILVNNVLQGNTAGKRVYVQNQVASANAMVQGWQQNVIMTMPNSAGWLYFVDLAPEANWEHPALLVFVSASSGEVKTYSMKTPPLSFGNFVQIGTYVPARPNRTTKSNRAESVQSNLPEEHLIQELNGANGMNETSLDTYLRMGPTRKFAVLISGGYDRYNNHVRYWNDTSFMYRTLKRHGFLDANIYVLMSDGLNHAIDRSDGKDSPWDLDGNGTADIDYSCTKANLATVFNALKARMTAYDFLFIFSTDHGGADATSTNVNDVVLYLWGDYIRDDQFAVEVNKITSYDSMVIAMEQCNSGGFSDDLCAYKRMFMSAASATEYSWSLPPTDLYDEWSYFLTYALYQPTVPYANAPTVPYVNADEDGDGAISFREAWFFAYDNDRADEHPLVCSNTKVGWNMVSLDGRYGTRFNLTNAADSVTYSLSGTGLGGVQVYVEDIGIEGDKWLGRFYNGTTYKYAYGSGSLYGWFGGADHPGFTNGNARVTYYSGVNTWPAGGYIKFAPRGLGGTTLNVNKL